MIGIGAAAVAGIGAIVYFSTRDGSPKTHHPKPGETLDVGSPISTTQAAAALVKQFDVDSRVGNQSGSVDVTREGIRHLYSRTSTINDKGEQPRSRVFGSPTGSRGDVAYNTEHEFEMDAAAFWKSADASSGGDGAVTTAELEQVLTARFGATLDAAALDRLRTESPGLFTGPEVDAPYNTGFPHMIDASNASERWRDAVGLDSSFIDDDSGSRAINISRQRLRRDGNKLQSAAPFLSGIDREFGNGNGLLSQREIGAYLAHRLAPAAAAQTLFDSKEVDATAAADKSSVYTMLGTANTGLGGGLTYNSALPKHVVEAHFGGSVATYLEQQTGYAKRYGAEWKPQELTQ